MDISEIPVLTRVVHKAAGPAADMDELIAQVRQALLPEITQLVTSQLASAAPASQSGDQQQLSQYAQSLQQELLSQAQARFGDSVQSIEQAFTEAMGNISKQQLQAFETQVAQRTETQQGQLQTSESDFKASLDHQVQQQLQAVEQQLAALAEAQANAEQGVREAIEKTGALWLSQTLSPLADAHQAQLESRVQTMRDQLELDLAAHVQQLQENSQQLLSEGHAASAAALVDDYRQSLQQAFAELNAMQMAEFRQNIQAEIATSAPVLQDKVTAIVKTQLEEMEAEMNKRLKARILEVLQGIKFVMPPL